MALNPIVTPDNHSFCLNPDDLRSNKKPAEFDQKTLPPPLPDRDEQSFLEDQRLDQIMNVNLLQRQEHDDDDACEYAEEVKNVTVDIGQQVIEDILEHSAKQRQSSQQQMQLPLQSEHSQKQLAAEQPAFAPNSSGQDFSRTYKLNASSNSLKPNVFKDISLNLEDNFFKNNLEFNLDDLTSKFNKNANDLGDHQRDSSNYQVFSEVGNSERERERDLFVSGERESS